LHTATMAPLLALTLTEDEIEKLTTDERRLYQKGLNLVHAGKLLVK
jgi:hypothetical protein